MWMPVLNFGVQITCVVLSALARWLSHFVLLSRLPSQSVSPHGMLEVWKESSINTSLVSRGPSLLSGTARTEVQVQQDLAVALGRSCLSIFPFGFLPSLAWVFFVLLYFALLLWSWDWHSFHTDSQDLWTIFLYLYIIYLYDIHMPVYHTSISVYLFLYIIQNYQACSLGKGKPITKRQVTILVCTMWEWAHLKVYDPVCYYCD